jgi:hypothetical protein
LVAPEVDGRVTHLRTGETSAAVAAGITNEPAGGSVQPTSDPIVAIEIS